MSGEGKLMSVALTEQQVRDRTKTVTRRLGWWEDKNGRRLLNVGDRLQLCRKVMGRKKGEPLVRVATVEVVRISREPLWWIEQQPDDPAREGFPHYSPVDFIAFFRREMKCQRSTMVTRIEWRYINDPAPHRCVECDTPEGDA